MNKKKLFIVSILIIPVTIFCLLFFHTSPMVRLWHRYVELSVPEKISENSVIDILKSQGCKNIISFSEQKVPLVSKFSPIGYNFMHKDNAYMHKRNNLFFDKSKEYKIYYVPEKYKNSVQKSVSLISQSLHCSVETDSTTNFPLTIPIIVFLFFLFLIFNTKNKKFFILVSLIPVFFSYSCPYYTNAAATFIYIYGIYFMQKFWHRDGFENILQYSKRFVFFWIVPVIITFLTSLVSGLLFILSSCCSFSIIYILNYSIKLKTEKKDFYFKNIIPAKMISFFDLQSIKISLVCAIGILSLLICLAGFNNLIVDSKTEGLYLPSIKGYTSKDSFPTLEDYVTWCWNTETFPYKSLNRNIDYSKKIEKGTTVKIPDFVQTDSGIKEIKQPVYKFGDSFTTSAVNKIDKIQYSAIEKLLKAQGVNSTIGYFKSGSIQFTIKYVVLLLVSFLIPAGVFLFLMTGRKKYVRNI